jgi:hypothetical protein
MRENRYSIGRRAAVLLVCAAPMTERNSFSSRLNSPVNTKFQKDKDGKMLKTVITDSKRAAMFVMTFQITVKRNRD